MTVYGVSIYGTDTYGYSVPPQYRVDPFTADPRDYGSIVISWTKPTGSIQAWRLVKNMYGFPVDQDDGQVLLDTAALTANSNPYFSSNGQLAGGTVSGAGWQGLNGTFTTVSGASLPAAAPAGSFAGKYVNNGITAGAAEESGSQFTAVPLQKYTVNAWVYSSTTTVTLGFDWTNSGTLVATTTQNFTVTANTWTAISTQQTAPLGINQGYARVGDSTADSQVLFMQAVQVIPAVPIGYPGNSFTDTAVLPGKYHYYGFYVQTSTSSDTWVRAATVGCLMLVNYGSAEQMLNLIPAFYINASDNTNQLEADHTGNLFLSLFLSVFGWGLDYLRTQYDTYLNVNDPWKIPLNDLYNLAAQLGLNINPDIHPYTLRKAVFSNAAVNQQRGTVTGIAAELSALTGYAANISTGPNLMLSNDQSYFADPSYLQWSSNITYNVNEKVAFGNYYYNCISTGNYGHAPTGTSSSNTWWQAILSVTDSTTLANPVTDGISTWEAVEASDINAFFSSALSEIDGVADPLNASNFQFNALKALVPNLITTDLWMRSISRTSTEIATSQVPGKYQVIADGIPVPYLLPFTPSWSSSVLYEPGEIVTFNNQPFQAARASLNSQPPYTNPGNSSQDWKPLSFGQRYRFCVSAYVNANAAVPIVPFVEWYDSAGNFISRVFSRNPGTTVGLPNSVCFDSFVTKANQALSGLHTDDTQYTWTAQTGSFSGSPYNNGCTYPTVNATRSIATVNTGQASCQVGMTFITAPTSGQSTGLILRYASNTSYLRADMTTLKQNNGGTITTLGTYSSAFAAGDRIMVQLNGNTITVLKNNVSVLSVTSSFNNTATIFGIISETT